MPYHMLGDIVRAEELLRGSLARLAEVPDAEFACFAHHPLLTAYPALSHLDFARGYLELALRTSAESLERVAAPGVDTNTICLAYVWAIWLRLALRLPDEAGALLDRLDEITEIRGSAFWRNLGTWMRGSTHVLRGEAAEGLPRLTAGSTAFEATGARLHLPHAMLSAIDGHWQLGDAEAAQTELERCRECIAATDQRFYAAEAERLSGVVGGGLAGTEAGLAHFAEARRIAAEQGNLAWELRAALFEARGLHAVSRDREAHDVLAPVFDRFTEGFAMPDLVEAKALLVELRGREGADAPHR